MGRRGVGFSNGKSTGGCVVGINTAVRAGRRAIKAAGTSRQRWRREWGRSSDGRGGRERRREGAAAGGSGGGRKRREGAAARAAVEGEWRADRLTERRADATSTAPKRGP